MDSDQTVCSGFMLFASILNSSVMLGNYLQQTNSADDIFRCIFIGAWRSGRSVLESIPKCSHKSPCTYLIPKNDLII